MSEKLGAEQGRALIEECGLALAAEEITCGHKHVKTFNKLNELRELAEQAYHARGAGREQSWNRVEDGLPTEYGNYLVVREHADLHDVSVAVTSFHPRGIPPWFDKGFNYLYWIGPIAIPKELPMVGHWTRKRFEEQMHETR